MRFVAVVALTLVPVSALAQTHEWSNLSVEDLSTVSVLDTTGQETTGEPLTLDADSLVLLVEGAEQRFLAEQVQRVDKRGDSLLNGFLIGAAIGAAIGAGLGLMSDAWPLVGALGFDSSGFGLGLGIDALRRGRTTLYDAPDASAGLMPPHPRLPGATLTYSVGW